MSFIFFIFENEFLILKTNLADFLILKIHFLTLENEFLILKKYILFIITEVHFLILEKKFLILKLIFQYNKISFYIKIN